LRSSPEARFIDLNADLGEGPGEEPLYPLITSANVACGGHAGTLVSMVAAVDRCRAAGVAVGAHPSYEDVAGFGRRSPRPAAGVDELAASIELQVSLLASHARDRGARLTHVKPHGALYNDAAGDEDVARAVGRGVLRAARDAILFGLAGSRAVAVWKDMGFEVAEEGFADRGLPRGRHSRPARRVRRRPRGPRGRRRPGGDARRERPCGDAVRARRHARGARDPRRRARGAHRCGLRAPRPR
jgi:lactam utilization protein B